MYSYLYAGMYDIFFGKVRSLDNEEIQFTNSIEAFGDGYLASGDYKNAYQKYQELMDNNDTKLDGIKKLKTLSLYRGDLDRFISPP